ncbi:cell cycle progression protein 1 isoform X1 [Peromyscus californicus insignis]|uniref:cell cycle progression protein 1 isoform X1 n=2 Tax=Peromyscus californicus insignis TaxID=564181 RepID=UPI0022A6CF1C|nr:cell cycle progression protein 1 isoform X1 [Peromyscus californicus insignis]XP_052570157.1 cell cycle progression protein 1 isoform X1 [Peromyscus californicus insignis]
MSENSSDSDSSCGWTVINHEGSDVEIMNSATASDSCELTLECSSLEQEELQVLHVRPGGGESSANSMSSVEETLLASVRETKSEIEVEEAASPEDNVYLGTTSDDSDIVTLEPPKLEEMGNQEVMKEAPSSDDFNMGSSSSSQYAFCQPEPERWWEKLWKIPECIRGWDDQLKLRVPSQLALQVFSSQPSDEESSSDDTSHEPSPVPRRRRNRKKTISISESEEPPLAEPEEEPSKEPSKRHFSGGLNKCVILALVIAVSMGFGHFYGTIQIQKRQQLVRKIHKDELNDVKDYLSQCQQEQESFLDFKSLKENLERCWTVTEAEQITFATQKRNLAAENQHLRISLEKEQKALSSLQEELRQLREQIRLLEDEGTSTQLVRENQDLKRHLEEEKQKTNSFFNERETLVEEAKALKRDLEREQFTAMALRAELEQVVPGQARGHADSPGVRTEEKEVALLRQRLAELEQKLTFEQQRSDLWERLYVEAKDQSRKSESEGRKRGSRGSHRAKSKSKETFLGTVKETFDAMKNSTKEFVRHHKEKIKQAKEAVKENLKKFSDSVKSTFRHFKDTTKNIFDEKGSKRSGASKAAATEQPGTAYGYSSYAQHEAPDPNQNCRGPSAQREGGREKASHSEEMRTNANSRPYKAKFECAGKESVRINDFRQLIEWYLLNELDTFHHWKELDQFISPFFPNGVFRHDQKLFADFVDAVKGYLKGIKEYQVEDDNLEKLDGYIYRHFGHIFTLPFGPSRPDKKQRMVTIENSRHRKSEQKHLHPQPYKREGKWHRYGRANGRHTASLEIELGQLPFDPKY